MYIPLNNFELVIISCLVYMLYDDKLFVLKSIKKFLFRSDDTEILKLEQDFKDNCNQTRPHGA